MKILVAGATGFLGRHLVPALARRHQVVATTRGVAATNGPAVTWVTADLSQPDNAWQLPPRVDAVLYAAQSRRYREFPEAAGDIFAVNVQSFWRFVDYARRVEARQFVFTSSANVYRASPHPLDEGAPIAPATFYATSKRMAEMILESYGSQLSATILRMFTLYGPAQEGNLLPSLIERVRNGRAVNVDAGGGLKLSPLYVTDACAAITAALEQPPARGAAKIFNVGGGEAVSIRSLAEVIAAACGVEATFETTEGENAAGWVVDGRRFSAETGWAPCVSLSEGLGLTIGIQRVPSQRHVAELPR